MINSMPFLLDVSFIAKHLTQHFLFNDVNQ